MFMGRRRPSLPGAPAERPIPPPGRANGAAESELDEYIHMGEKPTEEEDLFADIPEEEEAEDDSAPIPRIERDTKLEEEIEQEKYIPLEKLIADVAEPGTSLDPVRMYLRDIGRDPLLTADEELELAQRIEDGNRALAEFEQITGIRLPTNENTVSRFNRALQEIDKVADPQKIDQLEVKLLDGKIAHQRLTQSNLRLVVSAGFQIQHLCHLVDPPGDQPGHRRPGAYHPYSRAHGGDHQPAEPCTAQFAARVGPRAYV
jgi:RNA polymerase primary sigma factor